MLFWIGLAVLLVGGIVTRAAAKRGDEGEALKKVGIALIFLGTAALLFVLTVNILVWTGRYGVAGWPGFCAWRRPAPQGSASGGVRALRARPALRAAPAGRPAPFAVLCRGRLFLHCIAKFCSL